MERAGLLDQLSDENVEEERKNVRSESNRRELSGKEQRSQHPGAEADHGGPERRLREQLEPDPAHLIVET
jgi:hypothetical protein